MTILRGVKTSLFLLAVIGLSSLLSLSNPRPVQAEGLFDGLRCSVVKLLGRPCQPTVQPTTPPPPPSSEEADSDKNEDKAKNEDKQNDSSVPPAPGGTTKPPADSSSSSSSQPPSSSANAQQVMIPAPIELKGELLEEIPPIASVESASVGYSFPAHVAPLIQSGDNSAVLGETTTAPIEAGEGGWTVLGISWVWWLAAALSLLAGVHVGKRVLARPKNIKLANS